MTACGFEKIHLPGFSLWNDSVSPGINKLSKNKQDMKCYSWILYLLNTPHSRRRVESLYIKKKKNCSISVLYLLTKDPEGHSHFWKLGGISGYSWKTQETLSSSWSSINKIIGCVITFKSSNREANSHLSLAQRCNTMTTWENEWRSVWKSLFKYPLVSNW